MSNYPGFPGCGPQPLKPKKFGHYSPKSGSRSTSSSPPRKLKMDRKSKRTEKKVVIDKPVAAATVVVKQSPEDLLKDFEKFKLHNIKKPEMQDLLKMYAYPQGRTQNALVLYMNPHVDDRFLHKYIPGEIAIVSFSIAGGLNTLDGFWTLVDPKDIPKGWGHEAMTNSANFGIPPPGECPSFQNMKKIVTDMEAGIKKMFGSSAENGFTLFCSQENVRSYDLGLQWLYNKAEMPYNHQVCSLEALLVILSMGGLEALSKRHPELNLPLVVTRVDNIANLVASKRDAERSSAAAKSIQYFASTTAGLNSVKSYQSLGTSKRQASRNPELYPEVMLGAFMFEEQATRYLDHMDYVHIAPLACFHHQGKLDNLPPELKCYARKQLDEQKPVYAMTRCALTQARKQVYLALDVMLVNYQVQAVEGKHYPKKQAKIKYDSYKIRPY